MPNTRQKMILHPPKQFLDDLYDLLAKHGRLLVTGIGVFYVRKTANRKYTHPVTKKQVTAKLLKTVGLQISTSLKNYVQ